MLSRWDHNCSWGSNEEHGVLEVKCPWRHRNRNYDEMLQDKLKGQENAASFFVTKKGELKEAHNYWHQVQGEMVAANVSWAHFVIWTTKELKVIYVSRYNGWAETNIPKLTEFFIREFLPRCIEKKSKQ